MAMTSGLNRQITHRLRWLGYVYEGGIQKIPPKNVGIQNMMVIEDEENHGFTQ